MFKKLQKTIVCIVCLAATALTGMWFGGRQIPTVMDELAKVRVEIDTARNEIRKSKVAEVESITPATTGMTKEVTPWITVQREAQNAVVQVFSDALAVNWLEPYRVPTQGEGRGSGFFIDPDGYFLTNYHVVSQALRVQVQVPAFGKERLDAHIVGVSPERDLALLQIDEEAQDKIRAELGSIHYLRLGSSDDVDRGQELLSLGYPLGMEHLKSAQGILSGWERVNFSERGFGQLCFQITAPINPGSSGGPSLNRNSEVIGINFAGVVSAQNVGYVIPINDVRSAIEDLKKVRLLRKPRLGCSLQHTTKHMADFLKFPAGGGLYVARVMEGSLVERIGIKQGDIIREINNHLLDYQGNVVVAWSEDKVSGLDLLNRLVVGDKVAFVVYRDGNRLEFAFELETDEVPPIRVVYSDYEEVDYAIFGGLVVMELTVNHLVLLGDKIPSLIKYASVEHQYDKVLIVTHVMPTSMAHNIRGVLPVGTILKEVNETEVSTLADFRKQFQNILDEPFIRLKTTDERFAIFSVDDLVKDEKRLQRLFHFDPEYSVLTKRDDLGH